MSKEELTEKILELKEKKNAVIMGHNYQPEEVQLVADYLGGSLSLARRSTQLDADLVVFAGVDFMAEMTSILNPDKKVVIPDDTSTCPLAEHLTAEEVREAKMEHPSAPVVLYVNTFAEVKAEADVICTSANAPEIVNAMEGDEVIFGPDRNLASFVQSRTDKKVIPIPENGYCYVHKTIFPEEVERLRGDRSDTEVMVHAECDPEVQEIADHVCSTSQMLSYAKESSARRFIVGTEIGMVERLQRELPDKEFVPVLDSAICKDMKKHTLEKIYRSLDEEKFVVEVSEDVAEGARRATERMLEISS